jgi:uncharacterized protein YukE
MGAVSDLVSRGVRILFGAPGLPEAEIPADFFDGPRTQADYSAIPMEVDGFAAVCEAARVPTPDRGYGVQNLLAILESTRLASLPREVKIAAILASLDAAGAKLPEVIRDAVLRDRAIDDYLEAQEREVKELEARNEEMIEALKEEVEAFAEERNAEVARLREAWESAARSFSQLQLRKAQETERLYDLVAHFVDAPENPIPPPRSTASSRLPNLPAAGRPRSRMGLPS